MSRMRRSMSLRSDWLITSASRWNFSCRPLRSFCSASSSRRSPANSCSRDSWIFFAWGDSAASFARLTTPILSSAADAGAANASASAATVSARLIMFPLQESENGTNGELQGFRLVAVLPDDRVANRETQRTHRRQEGRRDTRRNPEFAYVECVDVLVEIARIQEQGKLRAARRCGRILRREIRQQQFGLHEGSQPSANRITGAAMHELAILIIYVHIPRTEVAFAEATDGIKPAGKEPPARGQLGGVAKRLHQAEIDVRGQRVTCPQREEVTLAEACLVVVDVAYRGRDREAELAAHAAVGEYGPVARVMDIAARDRQLLVAELEYLAAAELGDGDVAMVGVGEELLDHQRRAGP